tara:strand:- start:74 stop:418 length:345 start_codon:yes stop_codon:yes gene_type:complete
MIKKIKSRSDFLRLHQVGRSIVTPGFVLQSAINIKETQIMRFGFTASRKIGGAVKRNRAKRRLKALINNEIIEKFKSGMDYVLIARQATIYRNFQDMIDDLNWAIDFIKQKKYH